MAQPLTIVDEYTGSVEPGGPAQRKTTNGARIVKMSVGPMDNNVYLVTCEHTGKSLLIDAANEAQRVLALVAQAPQLELILTTHQHADHWQALAEVVSATSVPTAAHPLDAGALPVPPSTTVENGDTFPIGDITFEVIHLRGHTPGSVALATTIGDTTHLFTGDSLFPGGVGKTQSPEAFDSLLTDVTQRLFDRFPDTAVVYPGHGADTTLGAERPQLAEWRERGW
ncbi:MBL fold metallo-hydrolase [Hoyosella sp. YIM 151337]|uniref:MBL fold metallo-hydrolase n=1 Tax=Hoyosella sp. YIM 151337 TaxID=2992742 RepID=UPI002235FB4F|nr:MBL fold metallo-hydrolase [Hoyosella sp. YIM 151337]MCW4355628.1 MBL fold metallo-hydrolase [Hoyosella sp. YIM 151337]